MVADEETLRRRYAAALARLGPDDAEAAGTLRQSFHVRRRELGLGSPPAETRQPPSARFPEASVEEPRRMGCAAKVAILIALYVVFRVLWAALTTR